MLKLLLVLEKKLEGLKGRVGFLHLHDKSSSLHWESLYHVEGQGDIFLMVRLLFSERKWDSSGSALQIIFLVSGMQLYWIIWTNFMFFWGYGLTRCNAIKCGLLISGGLCKGTLNTKAKRILSLRDTSHGDISTAFQHILYLAWRLKNLWLISSVTVESKYIA